MGARNATSTGWRAAAAAVRFEVVSVGDVPGAGVAFDDDLHATRAIGVQRHRIDGSLGPASVAGARPGGGRKVVVAGPAFIEGTTDVDPVLVRLA